LVLLPWSTITMHLMKLATWNVNSVVVRLPLVLKWLDVVGPDILCLQETKCIDDKFPVAAFAEAGYRSALFGQRTYNGVAILSRMESTHIQRGFTEKDAGADHARLLALTIDDLRVINVYIPNGASVGSDKFSFKLKWMEHLRGFLDTHYSAGEKVVLCGDFNVAPEDIDIHNPKLWQGKIMCSDEERGALNRIKDWGFEDVFRKHVSEGGHFSWWDYRAGSFRRNIGLRIDHIWTTTSLAKNCKRVWIDKEPRGWERPSDHAPVVAEFE
jgi:exodeoxyribonuclease III